MSSDDEDAVCGFTSRHTPSALSPLAESSPLAVTSPLAESSSHMFPILLVFQLVFERELDFRKKRASFHGWHGLRPLRLRVEGRRWWWLHFNGDLLKALIRFWATKATLCSCLVSPDKSAVGVLVEADTHLPKVEVASIGSPLGSVA